MAANSTCDLRLVSVWHGPQPVADMHLSLYNNGSTPISGFTLCLTGTLWLGAGSAVRGGTVARTLSNFIEIRPDVAVIEAGGVWTFSFSGLNTWPRHAGDGPQSAYVVLAGGRCEAVAVQPLSRSRDAANLGADAAAESRWPATVAAAPSMTIAVIPFPNVASIAVAPLPPDIAVLEPAKDMAASARNLCHVVGALAGRVTGSDHRIFAANGESGLRRLALRHAHDARLGSEGYRITFDGSEIHVDAETDTGFVYGLITLAHMVVGARDAPARFGFPVRGTIADLPRFGWRGIGLDVARTFYPPEELKALVDVLGWLKLNILHLHLNDDEAWRLNVKGYPQVAEHAAWRGHGKKLPPLLGSSFAPYGGVYSPDDIAAVASHAKELSITLLPELDVPGHAHAVLEALPELRDAGDTGGYGSIQGFFNNALNPCLPQTYDFLGAAFDTLTSTFASPYVHIGGDEVGPTTWSRSPAATKAARELGAETTGELQSRLLEWVSSRLSRQGRTTVAWEDALDHAKLDPRSTVAIAWQHPERAHERARLGYDVVLAPANAYYLDMASTADWNTAGGYWAGVVPLERTYDFEPSLGWPQELLPSLRGIHACIWGEYMHDRRNFDALVFPRIFAFAERAWIDRATKDYAGFLVRAAASKVRVDRAGGNQG